ncbi:MAG: polyamine aminopropyltransferase [Chlamydiales bacterium]|jgi:spermidine synthase|nr:polyamine aminopropyltransferase [Chlamydiales bacterium]
MSKQWFHETLYPTYCQSFKMEAILWKGKSSYQDILIFENKEFGKVMALDSVVQFTTKDECIYHEMITHIPLFAHGNVKDVLIIGGGDGGVAREVLKHPNIRSVTLVEIDSFVIDLTKKYVPEIPQGVFEHPKLQLIVDDGVNFVKNSQKNYDVIITDSNDPIGPSQVLFTETFYRYCKKLLKEKGILVVQNGDFFMQSQEYQTTFSHLQLLFRNVSFYLANVPTYIGSYMTLGFASDTEYRNLTLDVLHQRFVQTPIQTSYYHPSIHQACFILPKAMQETLHSLQNITVR